MSLLTSTPDQTLTHVSTPPAEINPISCTSTSSAASWPPTSSQSPRMAFSAPHPRSEPGAYLCPDLPQVRVPALQHVLCLQVCVSSCPEVSWVVKKDDFSLTVGEVFYAANRNFCLPGVPSNMVSTGPNVITIVEDAPHGWEYQGKPGG